MTAEMTEDHPDWQPEHEQKASIQKQKFICSLFAAVPRDDKNRGQQKLQKVLEVLCAMTESDEDRSLCPKNVNEMTKRKFHSSKRAKLNKKHFSSRRLSLRPLHHYEKVFKPNFIDKSRSEMRAWRELTQSEVGTSHGTPQHQTIKENYQWHLHYLGKRMLYTKHKTKTHSIREVPVGDNYESFLSFFGYKMDYEYILKGYLLEDSMGGLDVEIRVFQIWMLDKNGDIRGAHKLSGLPWVVEIRSCCTDDLISHTEDELVRYGQKLEPILTFSKITP